MICETTLKYRDDITAGSLKLPESRLLTDLLLLLVNLHLRTHVSDRRKFFDAKDRLQKIKNLVAPDDAAADLDRKMIAVVAKADQPELFNIVRTVLHAFATDEHGKQIK